MRTSQFYNLSLSCLYYYRFCSHLVSSGFCTGKADGNYYHPTNCTKFVSCASTHTYVTDCPAGLHYRKDNDACDWKANANCPTILQIQGSTCYSTRGSQYGHIVVQHAGYITELQLKHASGYVTCRRQNPNWKNNWACNCCNIQNHIGTFVTDANNNILFPGPSVTLISPKISYILPGFTGMSDSVNFVENSKRVWVDAGQELRIWYGEDLVGYTESDNGGTHCVEVYAKYSQ